MLFLTGQYELALEFLWRIDKLKVHAVHMAIALHESNLLAIPNSPESPLCMHLLIFFLKFLNYCLVLTFLLYFSM